MPSPALAAQDRRFRTRVLSPLSYLSGHVASFGDVRMTRRKFEITAHMNERDFPHIVELALPPGGFRSQSLEFDAFHRERSIPIRRGCGRHELEQFHVRFCFPDAAIADAFQEPSPSRSIPLRAGIPSIFIGLATTPEVSCNVAPHWC